MVPILVSAIRTLAPIKGKLSVAKTLPEMTWASNEMTQNNVNEVKQINDLNADKTLILITCESLMFSMSRTVKPDVLIQN